MTLSPDLLRRAFPGVDPLELLDLDRADLLALVAQAAAELAEYLRRCEAEAPLSVSRLWTHPTAETDQRAQVVLGLTAALSVALGGNRSGKTHGAFDADVAVALGRDHPHVQAWCRLNDIDPELIPLGPGEVVIIAPSAGTSRRDHRRQIADRLPPGAVWYGQNGLQEAYVHIDCPGYRKKAVIWFKSVDQGPKAFKGSEARRYHIDEEPEGEDGQLVVEECRRGAASVGGHVVITGTPQAGMTWMVERLVLGKQWGAVTTRINSLHNRFAPSYAGIVAWLDTMDPDERAMRERGEWVDRRGPVYPQWSHGLHVVTPYELDPRWPRYRGIDFGQRNPTCVVWAALKPCGQLVVYRVRYAAQRAYSEWADVIHEAEGGVKGEDGVWRRHLERVELCWGDPSSPEAIEELCLSDVPTVGAHREVAAGISSVRAALRPRADGTPGLVVFASDDATQTGVLVSELVGYRYDDSVKGERPVKVRDHSCDALRYLVRGVEVHGGGYVSWGDEVGDGEE